MNLINRLPGVGVGIALCVIAAPSAVIVAIALLPVWSWLEETLKIEAVGHSGPAEWCYLVCYLITLGCASIAWWGIRNRRIGKLR